MISDMHDLHGGHQLVDANGTIGQALGTAPNLEEIARRNSVLTSLVDENHHLRFLEILAPDPADQRAAHAIGHRYRTAAGWIEAFDRKGALTVPNRAVG